MKCSKGLAAVLLVVLGVLALAGSQEQHCGSAPLCEDVVFGGFYCQQWSDTAIIVTDDVSYIGGESTITVEVNPSVTQSYSELFYKICYSYNNESKNLLTCASSTTQLTASINWAAAGSVVLYAGIYTDGSYENQSFLACATAEVYITENASLTLSVEVIDSPSSEYLTPLYPNDNHYHSVGNVTFISILNATFSPNEVYYSYDFGDGQSLINSLKQNVTHEYSEKGNFTYNVSVIAICANDTSYHAENSNYIILIDGVDDITVSVGDLGFVQKGCTVPVIMSADGSLPISACWHIESVAISDNQPVTPIQTCNWLGNTSVAQFSKTFSETGSFTFSTVFRNKASAKSGQFNVTVLSTSPCSFQIGSCLNRSGIVTVKTDNVSYIEGESTITVKVNPSVTQSYSELFYKICYTLEFHTTPLVLACTTGSKVQFNTTVKWPKSGLALITARVFANGSEASMIGCGYADVTIAENSKIALTVGLIDNATSNQPRPVYSKKNLYHSLGNITFVPYPNTTFNSTASTFYYYYDFGDGHHFNRSTKKNVTHNYTQEGALTFTVNVVAFHNKLLAYHAVYNDSIILIEGVSHISVTVGSDNSVQVRSTAPITLSADGKLPITVCWYITSVNNSTPINPNHTVSVPINNCTWLVNSSEVEVAHTFNTTGKFAVVSEFRNNASSKSGMFYFSVVSAPSPAVVASSTVVAVLAVIAVVIVLILLAMGGYIPYRRYRSRMTETADFRFVDLSEAKPSLWRSVKMKASKYKYFFSAQSPDEKVGLVEMTSNLSGHERFGRSGSSLEQFAPLRD